MPKNEVVERVAKKIKEDRTCPISDYETALELLGIVEYETEIIDEDHLRGFPLGNEAYTITQPLSVAFQLAREARERGEK